MVLTKGFDSNSMTSTIRTIEMAVLSSVIDLDPEIRVLRQVLDPNQSELTKDLDRYRDYNAR